jgi:hypothetical protein
MRKVVTKAELSGILTEELQNIEDAEGRKSWFNTSCRHQMQTVATGRRKSSSGPRRRRATHTWSRMSPRLSGAREVATA